MDTHTADHDWRGRKYMQTVSERDPFVVALVFWSGDGPVPAVEDRIILRHSQQEHGACYEVGDVRPWHGEGDVWSLEARFYPRSQAEIVADVDRYGAVVRKPVVL